MKKVALITGVSSGIGKALMEKMLIKNYFIIGTTRKQQKLKHSANQYFITLDLTDTESIENAINLIKSKFDNIDILINNAGIGSDHIPSLTEVENFKIRFETHIFGLYFFTESLISLIPQKGKIINISSKLSSFNLIDKLSPSIFTPTKTAYILSKVTVNLYTKILAHKLKDKKIKVLSIHPGWVKTKLSKTNQQAPMLVEVSAQKIYKIIES